MTANPPPPPNPPAPPAPPAPPPAPPAAPPSPPPSGGNPPWSESLARDILRWEQELKRVGDRLSEAQVHDGREQMDRLVTETRASHKAALEVLEARLLAQHGDKLQGQVEIVRAGIQQSVTSLQSQLAGTPAALKKDLDPRFDAVGARLDTLSDATSALKAELGPRFDALSAKLGNTKDELRVDIKEQISAKLDIKSAGSAHLQGRVKDISLLFLAVVAVALLFMVGTLVLNLIAQRNQVQVPWQPAGHDPVLAGAVDEVRKGHKELQAALSSCAQGRQELLAELKGAREELKQIEGRCEAPAKPLPGRPPATCSKGPRVQINNNLCTGSSPPASESPAR